MTNLDTLYKTIEELSPDELELVYEYIRQKRKTMIWTVSPENIRQIEQILKNVHQEAESMSDDEINSSIDEALDDIHN